MLTRKATCPSSLIASTSQHRNAATKLAPKWTSQPTPAPAAPSPSVPLRPPIPTSNLGKWALPRNNGPPNRTGANAPVQWALPDLRLSSPPRSPSKRPSQRALPSQLPPFPSSSPSLGKWARPVDIQVRTSSPSTSSGPSQSTTSTHRPGDDPRLDRDIAPHQGRIPRSAWQDSSRSDQRHHTDPRGPSRDKRWDNFESTSRSSLRQQTYRPERSQESHRSRGADLAGGGYGRHMTETQPERPPQHEIAESIDIDPIIDSDPIPPSVFEDIEEQSHRNRDASRDNRRERYKTRGSLLEGGEIEWRPRVSDLRTPKVKKHKPKPKVVVSEDVFIPTVVSVGQLARLLGVRLERLQQKMLQAGMADVSAYDHVLNSEYASMIALEFNKNPIVNDEAAFDIFPPPPHPDPSTLPQRPPVVTIMGHVDHGKTTLLDTLRSASVAKGEAGGITQHIGAFSVPVPATSSDTARTITFLDTPGHAAFSAMRARGASVTDIVVLVVAADDGVMPQTKEVIELVKRDEGKVSVVVAINKIDKPGVDPNAIQNSLLAEGVQLETFGGDIPSVEVSGLTGLGLDRLVETISAVAEMADYRAEQKGNVFGYVLESKILKGLGPVATVLVLRGDLTPAKHLISGTAHARVRHLSDFAGNVVKAAYPGMAVTVSGWKELPNAGDEVMQGSETDIKKAIANRRRRAQLMAIVQDAKAINIQRKQGRERKEDIKAVSSTSRLDSEANDPLEKESGPKKLRLVIKGDVSGSVEAVSGALEGIGNKEATVKIIQSSVGNVTESDVMMAKTAEGMIVAFSVGVPRAIEVLAAANNVPILTSSVIYCLMDDIKQKVIELLPPIIEKRVTGEAAVQQLFEIQVKRHEVVKIAGCRVTNGLIEKSRTVCVVRNGIAIHEGTINTFRHLKKDVVEMRKDMECGISLHKFDGIREGDIIQAINFVEKPGIL